MKGTSKMDMGQGDRGMRGQESMACKSSGQHTALLQFKVCFSELELNHSPQ